jgi:hypothetical protein
MGARTPRFQTSGSLWLRRKEGEGSIKTRPPQEFNPPKLWARHAMPNECKGIINEDSRRAQNVHPLRMKRPVKIPLGYSGASCHLGNSISLHRTMQEQKLFSRCRATMQCSESKLSKSNNTDRNLGI